MDKTDAILTVLKFSAILVSGILGVIGLLVDFKDREGKITKWGRRALLGVVASSMIAIIAQSLEVHRQRKDAKAAYERQNAEIERNHALLTEISRAVYPILPAARIYCTASATIDLTHPSIKPYRERLDRTTRDLIKLGRRDIENGKVSLLMRGDLSGRTPTYPYGVEFSSSSSLFPKGRSEKFAANILDNFGIEVFVFRHPIDPGVFMTDNRPQEDLAFRANADTSSLNIEYEPGKPYVRITSLRMPVGQEDFQLSSSGSIWSLPDLSEAQIFLFFKEHSARDLAMDKSSSETEKKSEIDWVSLYIANRQFFISRFKKISQSPYPVYAYTLPRDIMRADVNLP